MKNILVLVFIFTLSIGLNAQRVLSSQNLAVDTIPSEKGPNKKKFSHFYLGLGTFIGNEEAGVEVNPLLSREFEFGYRTKRALNRHLAWGLDFSFRSQTFGIVQNSSKMFPNNIQHDKESLILANANLGMYTRISFGKVGNYIGKFMDLGVEGIVPMSGKLYMKNEMPNGNIVKTEVSKLTYLNPYNYGAYVRFGFTRYAIWGKYRLSDMFTEDSGYPELSRISAGIQIGFH